jgi:hypothetical protein
MRRFEVDPLVPWPLRVIYGLLASGLLAAIVLWSLNDAGVISSHWIDVWAPHLAASTLELLVAAAVVDRLLRRHQADQLLPLKEAGMTRLARVLAQFSSALITQYAYMSDAAPPDPLTRATVIDGWLGNLRATRESWLPGWLRELDRVATGFDAISQRYGHVLDTRALTAIDRFLDEWSEGAGLRLRASYELAKGAPPAFAVAEREEAVLSAAQVDLVAQLLSDMNAIIGRYEEVTGEPVSPEADTVERFRLARIARGAEATAK